MSMRETIFPVTDMSDLTWTVSRLPAGDFGRHGWVVCPISARPSGDATVSRTSLGIWGRGCMISLRCNRIFAPLFLDV